MNSHGNTKVKDVCEYIFFNDKLFEHVIGAPSGDKSQRKGNVQNQKATDFLDLVLLTKTIDDKTGEQVKIKLQPE